MVGLYLRDPPASQPQTIAGAVKETSTSSGPILLLVTVRLICHHP